MSAPPGLFVVDQPGPGPLTVLVHGTLDRGSSFARLRRELADLHVIAYDRRGYGRSASIGAAEPSLDPHVDDLLAIIDERPAVVVGHSLGGDVALAAAVRRPDVVRAVACWEAPMPWMAFWPSGTAGGLAAEAAAAGPAAAAEAFFRKVVGDDTWEQLPEHTKDERRSEGSAVLSDLAAVRETAPFDLAAVSVPVVVGYGTSSRPQHVEGSPLLADALPDAELFVIDGATHGAHISRAADFAVFVRRAVARSGLS